MCAVALLAAPLRPWSRARKGDAAQWEGEQSPRSVSQRACAQRAIESLAAPCLPWSCARKVEHRAEARRAEYESEQRPRPVKRRVYASHAFQLWEVGYHCPSRYW